MLAIPYDPFRGSPEAYNVKNGKILDWLTEHPLWFNAEMSKDEIYLHTAQQLTSGQHVIWECWDGGSIVGLLCLSRVIPNVDAVVHFSFWGCSFFAGRKIVHNFLGWAFETFNLQRISCEVPEHSEKFLKAMRRHFGFRYEGEVATHLEPLALALVKDRPKGIGSADSVEACRKWIASFGARREKAHWNGTSYSDVYLLRLLRSEYLERSASEMAPDGSLESSDESRRAASPVPAVYPA